MPELMAELREGGIVLEICPTSNLLTKALPDELREANARGHEASFVRGSAVAA